MPDVTLTNRPGGPSAGQDARATDRLGGVVARPDACIAERPGVSGLPLMLPQTRLALSTGARAPPIDQDETPRDWIRPRRREVRFQARSSFFPFLFSLPLGPPSSPFTR